MCHTQYMHRQYMHCIDRSLIYTKQYIHTYFIKDMHACAHSLLNELSAVVAVVVISVFPPAGTLFSRPVSLRLQ